jgi:hypothetical protein
METCINISVYPYRLKILDLYSIPYMKIRLNGIIDLDIKVKTIKLIEENKVFLSK